MANPPDSPRDVTRRDFLKTTGAATASALGASLFLAARPSFGGAPAVSPRIIGANDRIHVGIVGVKGMGGGHVKHILEQMPGENVEVSAICDVWAKARQKTQADAGLKDDQVFGDYRRMLDARRELDAVIVATPDHTHALISIAAMESGRHVYVEKPMTRHLDEAFRLLDVSKRTKRLVQVGAQGCSEPKWQRAREIVKSGVLGRLLWAQGSYCRNNPAGEWNYDIDPEATEATVDWRAWLGPARKRPWSAERYFRWRKYWDYGTGVIGDLLPHRLSPLMLAMNLNEFPKTVSCIGGNLCDTDKGPNKDGKPNGERRDVADTQLALVEFASGVMFFLASTTSNERGVDDVIRGPKANLTLGGNKLVLEPERPFSDEIERKDERPEEPTTTHANHVRNFLEAMRGNGVLNCPIEMGTQVQTVVSMAEKAYREGTQVHFDVQRRKMTT
jgi:predicted dehydrogenase